MTMDGMLLVTDAEWAGEHRLLCSFSNGKKKIVDFKPLLHEEAYSELQDLERFMHFAVDGTVFWANGADIAPEWLMEHGVEV